MSTTKRWQESTAGYAQIDRQNGVIRGVKVLGLVSKNGRTYLREAASDAAPRYNGRKVYIDHIDPKASKSRKTRERWGRLVNVAPDAQGDLYGDLEYIKSHPMTESILEAAERFNDFGLSHDAGGRTGTQDNKIVVTHIEEIYSVDVVQDPATTKNLFESHEMKTKTPIQMLRENLRVPFASLLLARITEMDDVYGVANSEMEMEMEVPEDATADDQVTSAFTAAIMQIVEGGATLEEKINKIRMLLDVQQKVNGTSEESTMESAEVKALKAEVAKLQEEKRLNETKEACTKLLEAAKRDVTDVRVKALCHLPEADRAMLIESWSPRTGKPAASPGRFTESSSSAKELPTTAQDFRKALA